MFLIVGLLIMVLIILVTLSYFVFWRFHKSVNYVILTAICLSGLFMEDLHSIFGAILLFCCGLFAIKFVDKMKQKKNEASQSV